MTVTGIDVSKWQNAIQTQQGINFVQAKQAGAEFVFVKCSQATYNDRDWSQNWHNAKDAGLIRGAYHYMDWTKPAAEQARFFVSCLRDDRGELPPVCDYECRLGVPKNAGAARLALKTFVEIVKSELGIIPIIYTSPSYWKEFGSADLYWSQYPLWIAHYTWLQRPPTVPAPWGMWHFWQYTAKGDGAQYGVESKSVDLDYWHGTLAELQEFSGHPSEISDAEKLARLWADHPHLHEGA